MSSVKVSASSSLSYFGESRLKDVDSKCIGGCVAKSVGEKEEKLHFFNTASIKYMDVPIYKVIRPFFNTVSIKYMDVLIDKAIRPLFNMASFKNKNLLIYKVIDYFFNTASIKVFKPILSVVNNYINDRFCISSQEANNGTLADYFFC